MSISEASLHEIAQKKIFFGHQSVGFNLVDGIGDVLKEYPAVKLSIIESRVPSAFERPALVHAKVGRNFDPVSKLDAFARYIRGGLGDKADVALFKFCYVDIAPDTNVRQLFVTYKSTMEDLAKMYPRTRFAHITAPLRSRPKSWKNHVKYVIGQFGPWVEENRRRQEFNEFMRHEYAGRGVLFDLARAESTRPDGTLCVDTHAGMAIPCLARDYTYDSGHLNEQGRKLIAAQLLGFLAGL